MPQKNELKVFPAQNMGSVIRGDGVMSMLNGALWHDENMYHKEVLSCQWSSGTNSDLRKDRPVLLVEGRCGGGRLPLLRGVGAEVERVGPAPLQPFRRRWQHRGRRRCPPIGRGVRA